MNRKQSPKLITKEILVMGQTVTMYTLDEITWSTNPDEPLELLSRQEEGRLQLQVKVQAVPKEKTALVARGDSLNGLGDDEPFVADDDELKEDEVDDVEIDIELDDLDDGDDEDLPPTGKVISSGSKRAVSQEAIQKDVKKTDVGSKSPVKNKVLGKEITPSKVVPAAQVPKAKAAKGKADQKSSHNKPVKNSLTSAKKIEAPRKGKAVNIKVSPTKGKSPKKKG